MGATRRRFGQLSGTMGLVLQEIIPPDTPRAFPAMRELRPHLASVQAFTEQVDTRQRPAGYRLVGAFDAAEADASAVAGFRVSESLAWGWCLYVDDLSTRAHARRRGLARKLLEWVHREAVRLRCDQIHLDSGVGPEREDAHRLYLGSGYRISAHHFVRPAESATASESALGAESEAPGPGRRGR